MGTDDKLDSILNPNRPFRLYFYTVVIIAALNLIINIAYFLEKLIFNIFGESGSGENSSCGESKRGSTIRMS